MTRIKLCGLRREIDADYVNEVLPEYIGFIFVKDRSRYVDPETAEKIRRKLDPSITPVGVFIDEDENVVADLLNRGIIEMAQLHGKEDDGYISRLRKLTDKKIIKAIKVRTNEDIDRAVSCTADYVLLDSGAGTGKAFDWKLMRDIGRDFFLAGGLGVENVKEAISQFEPYAVDVSSGIETDGFKDIDKIRAFVKNVREVE